MKPLKNNELLFADIKVTKSKNKGFIKCLISIGSGVSYQGYLKIAIFRNGNYKKNIRQMNRVIDDSGYIKQDDYAKLVYEIKEVEDLEGLIICLLRYGFKDELKRIKFDLIDELMLKYKLLSE